MCKRIAYHISLELYPSMGFHPFVGLLDANSDYGTLYAIGRQKSLDGDRLYETCRPEDAVFCGTAYRIAQRVSM